MNENYSDILNKCILATQKNHPDWNINNQIINSLKRYYDEIKHTNNYIYASKNFCSIFSRNDSSTNEPIREKLTYRIDQGNDIVLELFDQMKQFVIEEITKTRTEKLDDEYVADLLNYNNAHSNALGYYNANSNLNEVKNSIYKDPNRLQQLITFVQPIIEHYTNNTLTKQSQTIRVNSVTDTARKTFMNIENLSQFKLYDHSSGNYKYGNTTIQMATRLGYKKKSGPQQDAILSATKDNCSINVVADGAGGSTLGQIASTITINELNNWFNSIDFNYFNRIPANNEELIKQASKTIASSLDQKLIEIDNTIKKTCQGSLSTVVISIVTPGFMLFANAGDSTAYVYDKKTGEVGPITELDSASNGLSYEEARHNPTNNKITNALGMLRDNVHYKLLANTGNYRVILSSDGITDLINADNFSYMLSNGYSAKDFVKKADEYPDVYGNMKSEDNISAIIIDSDDYSQGGKNK